MKKIVQHLCLDRGISVAQVERDLNFGKNTIGHWDKSMPKVDKFMAVCKYFDANPDEIMKKLFSI